MLNCLSLNSEKCPALKDHIGIIELVLRTALRLREGGENPLSLFHIVLNKGFLRKLERFE